MYQTQSFPQTSMFTRHYDTPTKDHRGKLIEDILLNSNHIKLNTSTLLLPNQTQQFTSSNITTALENLHENISWHTISNYLR